MLHFIKSINTNDIISWAHAWWGGARRRGAGGVSVGEAQILHMSVITFVRLTNNKTISIRNSFHAVPMITYSKAVGLRRFWTWASNRRQRVLFIESMTLIESSRVTAYLGTQMQ
jgi:hypothetical protein